MFAGVITEILVIRKLYKRSLRSSASNLCLILIFSEGIRWILSVSTLSEHTFRTQC